MNQDRIRQWVLDGAARVERMVKASNCFTDDGIRKLVWLNITHQIKGEASHAIEEATHRWLQGNLAAWADGKVKEACSKF